MLQENRRQVELNIPQKDHKFYECLINFLEQQAGGSVSTPERPKCTETCRSWSQLITKTY
jgi:hypothetical protein